MRKVSSESTRLQVEQDQKRAAMEKALLEVRLSFYPYLIFLYEILVRNSQRQQLSQAALAAKESELRLLVLEMDELRARPETSNAQRQRPTDSSENDFSGQVTTLNHLVESLGQDLKRSREAHDAARKK